MTFSYQAYGRCNIADCVARGLSINYDMDLVVASAVPCYSRAYLMSTVWNLPAAQLAPGRFQGERQDENVHRTCPSFVTRIFAPAF